MNFSRISNRNVEVKDNVDSSSVKISYLNSAHKIRQVLIQIGAM